MANNNNLLGVQQVVSNLNQMSAKMKRAARIAIEDCLLDLQSRAVPLAPISEGGGDLRGSCSVDVKIVGDEIVGYIGFDTPYALKQHEELNYQHPRGGQAKYLEEPFNAKKDGYERYVAQAVKEAID